MKKLLRKITAVLVAAGLMLPAGTEMFGLDFGTAIVASAETVGNFTVTGGTLNTDYTYADHVLTIKTDTPITISGTTTTDTIVVEKDKDANITLAGVNIDVSATGDASNDELGKAAFKIEDDSAGDVTITLADGSKNTLKGGYRCAGLQKKGKYTETLGKLTITGSTGKLNAEGGYAAAGIGDGNNYSGSNITISGGVITATGGYGGAGIGGGMTYGEGSHITISGGTVTATGGSEGAGIGGGEHGDGSDITISGGVVTATGGYEGAGIGGGTSGSGSNITISGGTVIANGGSRGAGIGGGDKFSVGGSGSNIIISGGTVTATGGDYGAGIGGGYKGSGSDITISGGTVIANGGKYGAGIGSGYGFTEVVSGSDITITGGTVTATGGKYGAGIGGGSSGSGSDITISGGTVTATGGENGAGIGGGSNGNGSNIIITGGSVKAVAGTDANAFGGGKDGNGAVTPTNGTNVVYLLTIANPDSEAVYIDGVSYTPVNHKALNSSDTNLYTYLTGNTHMVKVGGKTCLYTFNSGDNTFAEAQVGLTVYATNGGALTYGTDYTYEGGVLTIKTYKAITITNTDKSKATTDRIEVADDYPANITLDGVNISLPYDSQKVAFKIADDSTENVTITLADGSENTLKSGQRCAGLQKNSSMCNLLIQGGTNGTGKLTAEGADGGAGIGGGINCTGSNITINGGIVTATSGNQGAGIGGGGGGAGSNIIINGGTVTATGGDMAAGIGGGVSGSGSDITITGGTVTATGCFGGAGIGGGDSGDGSYITITGGTVTATGGNDGAGIGGGGHNGKGSDIKITGGSVNAVAGLGANAIGGGVGGNGAVPPTLADSSTPVYLLEIANNSGADITINDNAYPTNHNGEKKIYAYLPAKTAAAPNVVKVGTKETKYIYDNSKWLEVVTVPTADTNTFTYNGSEQTYTIAESDYYTVSGNKQTNAGGHTVTVALKDKDNTVWNDGTTDDKTYTFTINKATPNVTAPTEKTGLVYNGTAQALIAAGSTDFGTLLYSLDGTNYSEDIPTGKDAGNYTVYYMVQGNSNVNGTTPQTVSVSIGKVDATVIAENYTVKQGTDLPTLEYSATGLINGDTLQSIGANVSIGYSDATPSAVGDYIIDVSGETETTNYKLTYVNGTLTITDKEIQTITAADVTLSYGNTGKKIGAKTNGDGTISYAVKTVGDVINVAADGTITTLKAGTAIVEITAAETTTYAKAIKAVVVKVNKAAVTIKANNKTVYVGGDIPALDYTVTGLADGESLGVRLELSCEADTSTAGNYPITVKINLTEDDKYIYTVQNGTLTVQRKSTGGSSGGSSTTTPTTTNPSIGGSSKSWSDVAADLGKLTSGSEVTITLNGNTTVPVEVIKAIDDRQLKVTFVVDSAKNWKTDGAEITTPAAADLTFIKTTSTKSGGLRGIEGTQFKINNTNIPTNLEIAFKASHAGKFANLYKNVDGKLTFVTCAKLGANGKVVLNDVTEKGDYVAMLCEYSDRPGDMDNDGILNAKDCLAILKDFLEIEKGANPLVADFNGDGFINAKDSLMILKKTVGLA